MGGPEGGKGASTSTATYDDVNSRPSYSGAGAVFNTNNGTFDSVGKGDSARNGAGDDARSYSSASSWTSTSTDSSSRQSTPRGHPFIPQHPQQYGHHYTASSAIYPSSSIHPVTHLQTTGQSVQSRPGTSPSALESRSDRTSPGRHSALLCFGLLMVHSTFITLVFFDLLVLGHSLVFTITNYVNRGEKGANDLNFVSDVREARGLIIPANIPHSLLLPIFCIQVFWLVSALLALASLKAIQPYWQVPYLITSGIVLGATAWLIVQTIQALANSTTVEWSLALTLSFANVVFLIQLYFLYIKVVCIRALIRKRKSVVSTVVSEAKIVGPSGKCKANLQSASHAPGNLISKENDDEDTYSTKSTVVIADTPRLPPKSASCKH
ncbi:hypothetical protein Ddc_07282 [Ditylenchus destructor]|nr:hypothetical protein Ddc_07282 [Ditylenchus destructor]